MTIQELNDRVYTIFAVCCQAIIAKERYNRILSDKGKFTAVFPKVKFSNPKINLVVDENIELYLTTKQEIVNKHNHDLFLAWQIALGIFGMTSVLEFYLKELAQEITMKEVRGMGVFLKFSELTNIKIENFSEFEKINQYYQVRHLLAHNLGRIDEKFKTRTGLKSQDKGPYIFYTKDLKEYCELISKFADYVEAQKQII